MKGLGWFLTVGGLGLSVLLVRGWSSTTDLRLPAADPQTSAEATEGRDSTELPVRSPVAVRDVRSTETIHGRVVDVQGDGVVGVSVEARGFVGPFLEARQVSSGVPYYSTRGTTGSGGAFELTVLPHICYDIGASVDSIWSRQVRAYAGDTVRIVDRARVSLTISVVHEGLSVSDAQISVWPFGERCPAVFRTGQDGTSTVRGLLEGDPVRVEARIDGFSGRLGLARAGSLETLEVGLIAEDRMIGVVRNADREPISGASIWCGWAGSRVAVSGEGGVYGLLLGRSRPIIVYASAPGYRREAVVRIDNMEHGIEFETDIVLSKAGRIRVEVVDALGVPVPSCQVGLIETTGVESDTKDWWVTLSGSTDEQGVVSWTQAGSVYGVVAYHGPSKRWGCAPVSEGRSTLVRIEACGVVVGTGAKPGELLVLRASEGDLTRARTRISRVADSGRFEFADVPVGDYVLEVVDAVAVRVSRGSTAVVSLGQ